LNTDVDADNVASNGVVHIILARMLAPSWSFNTPAVASFPTVTRALFWPRCWRRGIGLSGSGSSLLAPECGIKAPAWLSFLSSPGGADLDILVYHLSHWNLYLRPVKPDRLPKRTGSNVVVTSTQSSSTKPVSSKL
jgi:hypothetical protein